MAFSIPTLSGTLYIDNIESAIAYTLNKFMRTPKNAVPLLDTYIISLPDLISRYGREPEALTSNIESSLRDCFDRIFANDRKVSVGVSYLTDNTDKYTVMISIKYPKQSGDVGIYGASIQLGSNGRLVIPEYTVRKA